MRRSLALRKETLTELSATALADVHGASVHFTIDTYPTWMCTPLAAALIDATKRATGELTLVECP